MRPDEALGVLDFELRSAGVQYARADAGVVLRVFKAFAGASVVGAEDGILYEIGIYAFVLPETFQLALVRQFAFTTDSDDDYMEQLRCTLHYAPDDDFSNLGRFSTWAEQYPTLADFFLAVESRPEWDVLRRKGPAKLVLDQTRV